MGWDGWMDISQTTRNARAPGGAKNRQFGPGGRPKLREFHMPLSVSYHGTIAA